MFSLEIMVDNKKLADVLWALDGLIIGEPQIRPVRGAAVKREGGVQKAVRAKHNRTGSMLGNVREAILNCPAETLTSRDIKLLARRVGASQATQSSASTVLQREGLLTRISEDTHNKALQRTYRINKPQSATGDSQNG